MMIIRNIVFLLLLSLLQGCLTAVNDEANRILYTVVPTSPSAVSNKPVIIELPSSLIIVGDTVRVQLDTGDWFSCIPEVDTAFLVQLDERYLPFTHFKFYALQISYEEISGNYHHGSQTVDSFPVSFKAVSTVR